MPSNAVERFVTTDGVSLAYCVDDFTDPWRTPETILLLHPAMSSMRRLFAWVPHLARQLRVVRLDLRGHGASQISPETSPITLERLSFDVLELLDLLALPSAHILGVSAGGFIAQDFAARFPARLRSLALVASTPKPGAISIKSWLPVIAERGLRTFLSNTIGNRFDTARDDPGLVRFFLDEMDRNDIPFVARFVTAMADADLTEQARQIACPTLMLMPGRGGIIPPDASALMQAIIRDHELIVYEGYNHQIGETAADRCAEDVRRFIDRRFGLPPLLGADRSA